MLLQAAGEFKELAGIGTVSGVVSLVATLALLLTFGPIASLGGILLGELVILVARAAAWRANGWRAMADTRRHRHSHLPAAQESGAAAGRHCRSLRPRPIFACWSPTMTPKAMTASTFAQLTPAYRWPLTAVIAAKRGIAQVRNTPGRRGAEDARPNSSP